MHHKLIIISKEFHSLPEETTTQDILEENKKLIQNTFMKLDGKLEKHHNDSSRNDRELTLNNL
jgi:hypothetical protein